MRVQTRTLGMAMLATSMAALTTTPTAAQVIYHQWSYHHPFVATRPFVHVRPVPLQPEDIIDILAEDYRYRRIGRPQFAGHIYIVDGIDRSGTAVRSYVDAFNGRVIDIDLLRSAPRTPNASARIARLPVEPDQPRATPLPPRRPSVSIPSVPATTPPAPRQASRPATATPVLPLSRTPRVVDPADVRGIDETDRLPPMARPSTASTAAGQPAPQAAMPQPTTVPGAQPKAPAAPDDATRRPAAPSVAPVPAAPLL